VRKNFWLDGKTEGDESFSSTICALAWLVSCDELSFVAWYFEFVRTSVFRCTNTRNDEHAQFLDLRPIGDVATIDSFIRLTLTMGSSVQQGDLGSSAYE
jgi:hypothetical protein